jgi:ribonuclease E
MSKEIYISSTPHETRLAIVEKDELTEIYYERENEYTLAGSIYNGKVTRVLPGMQSSFVDIGLERDAFLYITDFMEEAGDPEEFDVAGDGSRAPRTDRPRSDARPEGRTEGRDRGRGRRDGRNREAQPASTSASSGGSLDEPRNFAPVDDQMAEFTPREAEGEEIGEGAPGADGSRRWRGRRGRRRGRGDAPASESSAAEPVEASPEPAQERAPREFEPRGDRGGRDRNRGERSGDRNGREQDRNGRNPRHDAVRERFAPRGARPGGADTDIVDLNASAGPAIEPLILPGESLSKYRPGGEQTSAAPKPTAGILVAARPSSEAPALTGWDGGAVLPGETIRRREPAAESRASQPRVNVESRDEREDRGRDRRRDRDRGRNRETFRPQPSATLDPAEAVQPAVTSAHDTAEREYVPSYEALAEPAFESAMPPVAEEFLEPVFGSETEALPIEEDALAAPAIVSAEEAAEPVHEFHETTTEYEPGEDASASFRVDPAPPSEFRQAAAFEEVEELETPESAGDHEFTHIEPSGEMLSEIHEPSEPNVTAPIEIEEAVQSVTLHEARQDAIGLADNMGFAPGDGELEEELLDDDEIDAIHASAFDDDTEEDTLENTAELHADLGSMIRDMTIDDITSVEPAELEDDGDEDDGDDEEDDFEDDEDFEEDELESNGEEDELDEEVSGSEISEAEEEEFAEAAAYDEEGNEIPRERAPARPAGEGAPREGHREGGRRGRRDGRRGGRDRGPREADRSTERAPERSSGSERSGSSDRNGSERNGSERSGSERSHGSDRGSRDRRGMAGSRSSGGGDRRGYGGGSRNTQAANLPAISDLLKPGQEVLVQIAKEPIAKKGARITSHIALPGRFLVFMPTVSHTGVSRKIESDAERRRLKEILLSERGDASGGFIVRTAAAGASEEELRSDLRFLLNLWADIKARSDSSKSPALIYHDLNLIERILRDQVTDNFSAIWCDTETEYERVLRFLQRFQPSLIRRVKLYTKDTPLFEQFGITEEINKALRSKVWLKSGGSIVINQTEALVAIDINTGKFVGKTTKLEDTIVKTNLDSIPEIVRQIRLRDLGGIIIIDFIDMDERKNRNKVMAALEEELKKDRAPSKVLQFNDFGLVAITRKRVKQSLERTLSTTCAVCQGTGMTKSAITVCNDIYIEMRKMHKLIEKGDIMLRVHPEVVKQLKSGGKWLQEMEEMSGKTILIKSDPSLHPEQFDIH